MITDVEIANAIIEIVAWAVDEDVTNPKDGMMQLKGLRMALRGMGVHFTWHREIAKWEDMLAGYRRIEEAKQYKVAEKVRLKIQGCCLAAYRALKDEGYIYPGLCGSYALDKCREVCSDSVPDGVKANP